MIEGEEEKVKLSGGRVKEKERRLMNTALLPADQSH